MKAYDEDLAYIHDVGFTEFAKKSGVGVLHALCESGISDGRIVDLGCGSGVWARQLADAGYDVVGADISQAMIDMARKRVPAGKFHVQSFLKFKFPPCRAVTALGEIFNYLFDKQNGAPALSRLCRRIHSALEPGGMLIFDVAQPGRSKTRVPSFFEGDDWACLVRYEYDDQPERLTRHITSFRKVGEYYRRGRETHQLQLYRAIDVAKMLRQIGFRVRTVRSYGDYPLAESIVGFIARKP